MLGASRVLLLGTLRTARTFSHRENPRGVRGIQPSTLGLGRDTDVTGRNTESTVNPKIAVGLTIGVLAGLWTWASVSFGMLTWVAFISWALFFAAGGGTPAIGKVLAPGISGVVYGVLALLLTTAVGGPVVLPVAVAGIAFLMCAQSIWSPLGMIPAAFGGAAALFGGGGDWLQVGAAFVLGALFGRISEWTAGLLTSPRRPSTVPATLGKA